MCSPTIAVGVLSVATTAISAISQTNSEKENVKYSTKIADINTKNAIEEAKNTQQMGIEEARKTKAEGIQKAKTLNAKVASSGFDVSSTTNLYNYNDIYSNSESEANSTQNKYNLQAQKYYNQANLYSVQKDKTISDYNSNVVSNALGLTSKVANTWKNSFI